MPNIREILKHGIIICLTLLASTFYFCEEPSAVQRSQRALDDVILLKPELSAEETANYFKRLRWLECTLDPGSHFFSSEVYKVTNESIQPASSTESDALTPGDGVDLKDDVMQFVMTSNNSNNLNLVVDIPRLLEFEIMVVVDEDAAGNKIFCTRAPGSDFPD